MKFFYPQIGGFKYCYYLLNTSLNNESIIYSLGLLLSLLQVILSNKLLGKLFLFYNLL